MKTRKRKAQIWGIDLLIAIVIFLFAIFLVYKYSTNFYFGKSIVTELAEKAAAASSNLLSDGFPPDWNKTNVVRIGLLSAGEINKSKIQNMLELAEENYTLTKNLLNIKEDYYFFLSSSSIIFLNGNEGIGKKGINSTNINEKAKNIAKISRFTIYEKKPVKLVFYLFK